MRLIDADKSDEIIVFDKQNELLQCSVVRDYCERQREFLNKFPTIDAEPVVRCKDCRYCDPENKHCDHPMGTLAPFPRKDDDFCSYGERKGGDE